MKRSWMLPATLLLTAQGAQAQFRCDCTSIVDTCAAEVTIRGSAIDVTTEGAQCARVDYFIDGQPFVSLVVDGEARESWVARTAQPRVLVQSCQVCLENTPSATTLVPRAAGAAEEGAADQSGAELAPLIEVAPTYPPAALARRVQGRVDVEFTVTPAGAVENARVTGAEPSGLFEQAALAAVTRSRYRSDPERSPQTLTKRLEFNPPAAPAAPAPRATSAAAAAAAGPRNGCVREDAVYNFGEMIEVGLLNACDEPLLVYSCAEGTGRHAARWTCTDSERQSSVLMPPGRAMPVAEQGPDAYSPVESFFVTRAPNSQYWWVACRRSDADCQARARLWTRAVEGQSATVDPQARASVALARSY